MGWREAKARSGSWRNDPRTGNYHLHLDRLPGSPRRGDTGWCTATTRYDGIAECCKREGHRGPHEDEDGYRWSDDEAIY